MLSKRLSLWYDSNKYACVLNSCYYFSKPLCDLKVLILVVNTLQMRMRIISMAVYMSPYVLPTSTLVECFNQFACILK